MAELEQLREIIETYGRHGWQLRRVLMSAETHASLAGRDVGQLLAGADARDGEIDALWFARASHGGREAWELRLVAPTPYALFETFEPDETEEEREDVRREMEARLRDYASSA